MKSELRHLLDKLKAEKPNFKQLVFSHNGRSMAVYGGAPILFESLDELEAWLYRPAPSSAKEHEQCQCAKCVELRKGSSPAVAGLAPSAQDVGNLSPQSSVLATPKPITSGYLQTQRL
ncbi:MAG TPA: hypothetical protein VM680_18440 [Verrucomicrobiae bacterium]|nr:hypothetical protein [Verrucomicrobiae bacterium]